MGYRDERGAALIIVLLMVTVLVAVALEMSRSARSDAYETANLRDRLKALYLAKSGFYRAEAALAEDSNAYDALFEKWARPEILSAQSSSLIEDGWFSVEIEDESGRIPVNRLVTDGAFFGPVKDALTNLLMEPEFKLDAQKAALIVSAIKDYIDPDTEATSPENGSTGGGPPSESGSRAAEPPGYKNKPLDSLEELLAIKEITPELFYGTTERPGLSRYLTVYGGEGRININTAPRAVLKALAPEITDDKAGQMEDFRKKDSSDLADPGWYRKIPGLSGANIQQDLITIRSRTFRVTATGTLGPKDGAGRTGAVRPTSSLTAVVERRDPAAQDAQVPPMRVLSWKVE